MLVREVKILNSLVEKFKEDFSIEIESDTHICPDTIIQWLEENG